MSLPLEIRDGVRRDNYLQLQVTPPPTGVHWPVFDEQGLHHLALPLQRELFKWNPAITLRIVPKTTDNHHNNYWLKADLEDKKLIVGITDNVTGRGRSHGWPHVYINSPPRFMMPLATAVRAALQQCVLESMTTTALPTDMMPMVLPDPPISPMVPSPLPVDETTKRADANAQTPLPLGWHVCMDAAKESLVWVEESTGTIWEQFGLPKPPHLPWWWTESRPTEYQLTRPWEFV